MKNTKKSSTEDITKTEEFIQIQTVFDKFVIEDVHEIIQDRTDRIHSPLVTSS